MMEDSKSSEPPRCSCGFFGSSSTLGMCSKCYKAHQEKTQDTLRSTPDHMICKQDSGKPLVPSTHGLEGTTPQPSSSKVDSCFSEGSKDSGDSSNYEEQKKSVHISTTDSLCINTESQGTCLTPTKHPRLSDDNKNQNGLGSGQNSDINNHQSPSTSTSNNAEQESRGLKRDISALETDSTPESTPEKGQQKNKKRCFHCNTKLELAQRQIGRCRCEFIFCALHRLPELHNCDFDHKEDGRREARQKMVKPTRHLGNAFRRIDSDS